MTNTVTPDGQTPLRGLAVSVYRWSSGDCTDGGISATARELTVVAVIDDRGADPFQPPHERMQPLPSRARHRAPHDGAPAAVLRVRTQGTATLLQIEPYTEPGQPRPHYVSGGNLAACSDSRWTRLVRDLYGQPLYAGLHIHDRVHRGL